MISSAQTMNDCHHLKCKLQPAVPGSGLEHVLGPSRMPVVVSAPASLGACALLYNRTKRWIKISVGYIIYILYIIICKKNLGGTFCLPYIAHPFLVVPCNR